MAGHRERLLESMVQCAALHGHSEASVSRVVERAGVSRATFYEHYRNRDECFRSAYWAVVGRLEARICRRAAKGSPAPWPRSSLEPVLIELAADEHAAALLLHEAGGADQRLRCEHDSLVGRLERELAEKAAANSDRGLTSFPPAALLGGAAHVAATRVANGEAGSLPGVFDELFAWADSYRLPAAADRPGEERWHALGAQFPLLSPASEEATAPLRSPRGRNALSGPAAAEARREKILIAVSQVVAAKGYRECAIDDIVATAHVSRAAFYSHFTSKEDAFLAAQKRGFQGSIAAAVTGFSLAPTWPQRVWAGLRELLTYVAQHPAVARVCLLETPAAGRIAIQREHENRMAYGLFLEEGFRGCDPPRLPSRLYTEAITGAIFGVMRRQLLRGRGAAMLEVLAPAAFVALAPFLGALPALSFIEAEAQGAAD